jgi:hypothetical protein
METSQINLEPFQTSLHGAKILVQGPFPSNKMPPLIESIQNIREPFKKKILLSNTVFGLSKYIFLQYDTTFKIKDNTDWTMFLTYVTYAPKPLLIVSEDIVIPDGLWGKLTRAMTFLNITSSQVLSIRPYDTIFFPVLEEIHHPLVDYIHRTLQSVYRASYSVKENREIIQELRIAGAGIIWTRVQEESKNGDIYWYDPVAHNQGDSLSHKQMSELFRWLSEHFES